MLDAPFDVERRRRSVVELSQVARESPSVPGGAKEEIEAESMIRRNDGSPINSSRGKPFRET